MLGTIGRLCSEFGLVEDLPAGSVIFRARESKRALTVRELGPPPRDLALQSNRMSPAGIVMFYASPKSPFQPLFANPRLDALAAVCEFVLELGPEQIDAVGVRR